MKMNSNWRAGCVETRLSGSRRAWRKSTAFVRQGVAILLHKNNPQAAKLLAEARELAYSPVVSEEKSKDKEFLALYRNTKRDAEKTKQTTALEEYWSNTARKNYARAVELANQAAALAK